MNRRGPPAGVGSVTVGRQVEGATLDLVARQARLLGARRLVGEYSRGRAREPLADCFYGVRIVGASAGSMAALIPRWWWCAQQSAGIVSRRMRRPSDLPATMSTESNGVIG